eukprot:2031790-Karenia_brevis.AAC.1
MWSCVQPKVTKRKKGQQFIPRFVKGEPDIQKFVQFLSLRIDADGRPLMDGLETPVEKGHGWWELKNKMFDEDKLPKRILGPHQGSDGPIPYWVTCAHGTPVEALYSIVS